MPIISFNMDTVLETGFNVTTIIKETAFLSAGWNMAADGDGARSKGFVYGTVLGGIFQRTPQVVNTELYIAPEASVDATGDLSAIEIGNAFGHAIVNDGRIGGLAKIGIEFDHSSVGGPGTSSVTNTGTIRGVVDGILGLSFAGSSPAIVNILNMGEISSPGDAIDISRGRVDNKGTIIGDIAFRLPGDSVLVNTGTILGDVLSAAPQSNVLIDSRQGILVGKITTSGGADKIYGSAGDDTIASGDGNDRINGHLGADDMDGGNGNDIYTIEDGGDVVTDSAGTDTIRSFISIDLTDGDTVKGTIELLRLMGEADLRAAGTDGTDQLQGNVGDNELLGAGQRRTGG